jgi:mono/diheme cytochrome c family protein
MARSRRGLLLALLLMLPLAGAEAQTTEGQAVFLDYCRPCHGIDGVPAEPMRAQYRKLRALGDSGFVSRLSEVEILMVVSNGLDQNMRSFSEVLTPGEIFAVAGYIKQLAEKRRSPSPR